jgi:hypothetical protein
VRKHPLAAQATIRSVDYASMRVLAAHVLDLEVEVGAGTERERLRFLNEGSLEAADEPRWRPLAAAALPPGGLLPGAGAGDAGTGAPAAPDGAPVIPDFVLEGPLELHLPPPRRELRLWLPLPADGAGAPARVLLRAGAAVVVRGARSAALRRPLDLPALSLADFAAIAAADATGAQAAGLMHLAAGVRAAAAARWNASSTSPALVAIDVRLSDGSGALLAAPGPGGAPPPRLRARRLAADTIELAARDMPPPAAAAAVARHALAALGAAAPTPRAMWPLRGAAPATVRAYEALLREVLTSRMFGANDAGGAGPRFAPDVPLRLLRSRAEGVLLLRLDLLVDRPPARRALAAGAVAVGAADGGDSPDAGALFARQLTGGGARRAARERWQAVLRVEGGGGGAPLRLRPVSIQAAGGAAESATFSGAALRDLLAGPVAGNLTLPGEEDSATPEA